jgi:glutathione S-transferase
MLTLYFAPGASSMAVHIALHEIGAAFEGKPMSFRQNDMRSPEYLALNPEGKVPTLVVDGRPLTEVAAILFYLARCFPDAGLLPRDDIEAEAQALSWMSFIASTLHPARKHGLEYAKQVYGIADRRLGNGWALGRYSIADIPFVQAVLAACQLIEAIAGDISKSHRALHADDGPARRAEDDRG